MYRSYLSITLYASYHCFIPYYILNYFLLSFKYYFKAHVVKFMTAYWSFSFSFHMHPVEYILVLFDFYFHFSFITHWSFHTDFIIALWRKNNKLTIYLISFRTLNLLESVQKLLKRIPNLLKPVLKWRSLKSLHSSTFENRRDTHLQQAYMACTRMEVEVSVAYN